MAKKLTPKKAQEILRDGTVHGKPLTDKQRRFFGAMTQAQAGNTIYVSNPNDPQLKSYQDSLNLYKAYQFQKNNFKPGYEAWLNSVAENYPKGKEELRKVREKNIGKPGTIFKDKRGLTDGWKGRDSDYDSLDVTEKPIVNYYKSLVGNNPNFKIGKHSSPDLWHKTIKPVASYYDGAMSPVYKKPVQPVVYDPNLKSKTPESGKSYDVKKAPPELLRAVKEFQNMPGNDPEVVARLVSVFDKYKVPKIKRPDGIMEYNLHNIDEGSKPPAPKPEKPLTKQKPQAVPYKMPDISIQAGTPTPQRLEQPKTPFSFTYRDENNPARQSTQYFPNLESWKQFTEANPYISRDVSGDNKSAQGVGYRQFKGGGNVIADDGAGIVYAQDGPVAHAGPGYQGLGYSNSGYNYNSAWGGRFQSGGYIPKAQNGFLSELYSKLNPYNWGVDDYSDKKDFSKAYSSAKKAGEEEFMYNGKRYNTTYGGTPRQEVGAYGVNGRPVKKEFYSDPAMVTLFPKLGKYAPGHIAASISGNDVSIDYSSYGNNPYGIKKATNKGEETYYVYGADNAVFNKKAASLPLGIYDFNNPVASSTWNLFTNNCADNTCDGFGIPRSKFLQTPPGAVKKIKEKYPTLNVTGRTREDYSDFIGNLNEEYNSTSDSKKILANADKLFSIYQSPETRIDEMQKIGYLLQKALVKEGYELPGSYIGGNKYNVDKIVGPETEKALKDWKKQNKISSKQMGGNVGGGSLPGATGMMYARTGPTYRDKKEAGGMLYYEQGLDWQPKSMQSGGVARGSSSRPMLEVLPTAYVTAKKPKRDYKELPAATVKGKTKFQAPMSARDNTAAPIRLPNGSWANAGNLGLPRKQLNKMPGYTPVNLDAYDAITDYAQFIPGPAGDLAETAGMAIDAYQAYDAFKHNRPIQGTINTASALLPFLPESTYKTLGNILETGYDTYQGLNASQNYYKQGGRVPVSSRGLYEHPNQVVDVPTSDGSITMADIDYPVYGVDNTGMGQMMMPGGEYEFDGDMVRETPMMKAGGEMIKRADGSYSRRGLWDNIRANKGSGKEPTKEMLKQERKIKRSMEEGGVIAQAGTEVTPQAPPQPSKKSQLDLVLESPSKFDNGKTFHDIVKEVATESKVDPRLLWSSSFVEGMNLAALKPNQVSNAYLAEHEKSSKILDYPVDGFYNYGLDNFGDTYPELVKRGYLPKDFDYYSYKTTNEQNRPIKTAAFRSNRDAVMAKAAYLKYEADRVKHYATKQKLELTPDEQAFFTMAAYNGGLGSAQAMLEDLKKSGLTPSAFIKQGKTSKGQVYKNVKPRYDMMFKVANMFEAGGEVKTIQDMGQLKKLDQLINFTNYNYYE